MLKWVKRVSINPPWQCPFVPVGFGDPAMFTNEWDWIQVHSLHGARRLARMTIAGFLTRNREDSRGVCSVTVSNHERNVETGRGFRFFVR